MKAAAIASLLGRLARSFLADFGLTTPSVGDLNALLPN